MTKAKQKKNTLRKETKKYYLFRREAKNITFSEEREKNRSEEREKNRREGKKQKLKIARPHARVEEKKNRTLKIEKKKNRTLKIDKTAHSR